MADLGLLEFFYLYSNQNFSPLDKGVYFIVIICQNGSSRHCSAHLSIGLVANKCTKLGKITENLLLIRGLAYIHRLCSVIVAILKSLPELTVD